MLDLVTVRPKQSFEISLALMNRIYIYRINQARWPYWKNISARDLHDCYQSQNSTEEISNSSQVAAAKRKSYEK